MMTEQEIRAILKELAPVIEQARIEKNQGRLTECAEILTLLEKQLPKKKRILFLPYKASMWDSLESIWRAAIADTACEAIVVPIPYAERNADGSCGAWHCEADRFPQDVPIVDWQVYDLRKHQPDVIYIHNPYDDGNRITMVEPGFFSRNLRPYTKMLVYVPYFAWSGYWPENHLNLPCYSEVDKIIVQRAHYQVVAADKLEKDMVSLESVMPEGKLAALGSPKLDRVWWCEHHKEIPEHWAKKIAGRKTVLYNTSVAPVMTYGQRSLDKMRQVFHVFSRHPELVLLWRPHPLLETMLRSQKNDLLESYQALVTEFKNLPNGIYDMTADVDRSVALADAYLGESSSVVQLFAVLGKPVFYNDLLSGEPTGDEQRQLASLSMLVEDGMLYFWGEYLNALCRMQIQTGKVDILCSIELPPFATGNFGAIVKSGEHLVLVPMNAKVIVDYDLESGTFQQIPLDAPMNSGNFRYAEVYADKVYMIGYRYPAILIYDVLQGSIRYERACFAGILSDRSGRHEEMLGKPCRVEDRLYIPVLQSNHVLEFSLKTEAYWLHTVGPDGAGYGYAEVYEGNIWLAPWMGGPIARWNPLDEGFELFPQFPHDFAVGTLPGTDEACFFSDAVSSGPYWWLMPLLANQILRVDMRDGSIEHMPIGIELETRSSGYFQQLCNVWCAGIWRGKVLSWCGYDRKIRVIAADTGVVEACWSVQLTLQVLQRVRQCSMMQSDFVWISQEGVYAVCDDGLWHTIDSFCDYVASGKHDRDVQRQLFEPLAEHADGTCGVHVHQYIMQCLAKKQE